MKKNILKTQWERFKAHIAITDDEVAMLLAPYTTAKIAQCQLLAAGCANSNYLVNFQNGQSPVVLRIYLREHSALQRELDILTLVASKVPVAQILYADSRCQIYSHPYAIMEWVDGQLMRDVILSQGESAIAECAYDAGLKLAKLREITFNQGGFFEEGLSIRPFNEHEQYLPYVLTLLQDEMIRESLGKELLQNVRQLVCHNAVLLPNENEANLTHGDYDPANILVKQHNGKWQIAAILDWEFAYAGTYLLDMGLMLRYSHRLPACYEQQFIQGLQESGGMLPSTWKKQAKLMDLLCLLQLIHYNPLHLRPAMNQDVVSLIFDIIKNWHLF